MNLYGCTLICSNSKQKSTYVVKYSDRPAIQSLQLEIFVNFLNVQANLHLCLVSPLRQNTSVNQYSQSHITKFLFHSKSVGLFQELLKIYTAEPTRQNLFLNYYTETHTLLSFSSTILNSKNIIFLQVNFWWPRCTFILH